jgi:hypothetical protein
MIAKTPDRGHVVTRRSIGSLPHLALSVVVALVAAAVLAACGGPGAPSVAKLGTTGSTPTASTTTTLPAGEASQMLVKWAACMRTHGDPGQVDPSITVNKLIKIAWNPAIADGSSTADKIGQACQSFLAAAQSALEGGPEGAHPDEATLEKFSACMRASGITNFPDPTSSGLTLPTNATGSLNPDSPQFQSASKRCSQTTGAYVPFPGGPPPPGTIVLSGTG